MSSFTQPTIALQTTMTLIMLGLIFAVLVDSYMDSRRSRFMMGVVGVVFLLLLQNRWEYLLELSGEFPYRRMLVSMLGYICVLSFSRCCSTSSVTRRTIKPSGR